VSSNPSSLHSTLTVVPAPESREALAPKVRQARKLAAFVNEVFAEMTRKYRFVPGTDRVERCKPMSLRAAWAAALKSSPAAEPIDDLETIVGVSDILRAQRPERTGFEFLTPTARLVAPRESHVDHVLSLVTSREKRDPDDLVPTEGDAAHPWKGSPPVVKNPRGRHAETARAPSTPAAHPLDGPVLTQLARRDKTADAIAWELGEAPLDVDDVLSKLESASRVEKVPGGKWRIRR
jgi:hypothetical protein